MRSIPWLLSWMLLGWMLVAGCDGGTYAFVDGDGDGFPSIVDCDDRNVRVHPGASEACGDFVDSDCDGGEDTGNVSGGTTYYLDEDGDGYGRLDASTVACAVPAGYAEMAGDCDDTRETLSPGNTEVCGGLDEDCDGLLDGADPSAELPAGPWYVDVDGDDYGSATPYYGCVMSMASRRNDDCNDASDDVHPGAIEVCGNGVDEDCDGAIDANDPDLSASTTFYRDADFDLYGATASAIHSCTTPGLGWVQNGGDCNDADGAVHPSAGETCGNAIDDDCNGHTDGVLFVPTASFLYPEVDMTALFESGTESNPAVVVPPRSGTIHVCPGTYFVRFRPNTGTTVVLGKGTRDETILDGGDGTTVVLPTTANLEFRSLTLRGGTASQVAQRPSATFVSQLTAGGVIHCTAPSSVGGIDLELENVVVEDGNAQLGGCIFMHRCTLVANDVELRHCTASYDGGGAYLAETPYSDFGGTVSIHDNVASMSGGGLFVYGNGGDVVGATFTRNTAALGTAIGGIQPTLWVSGASFSENGPPSSASGTVYIRDASYVVEFVNSTFDAVSPDVMIGPAAGNAYDFVGPTSVTCWSYNQTCQ